MAKTFLDELIVELLKLQSEDVDKARAAIENGEHIPAPASPKMIFDTFNRVAADHKVTAEEMAAFLSLRGGDPSSADIDLMQELNEQP